MCVKESIINVYVNIGVLYDLYSLIVTYSSEKMDANVAVVIIGLMIKHNDI